MITLLIAITITIALGTIIRAKEKYGFWFNHYTLHNAFWLMTIILSYYFNHYLTSISDTIYYIFIFGLLFFNSSILLVPNYSIKPSPSIALSLKKRRLVEIIILSLTLPQAYVNYKLIQQGVELWAINSSFWNNQSGGVYIYQAIMQSIVAPLSIVLISTCFYNNYYDSKKYSQLLTISIALLFGVINLLSTGGGRTGILHLSFIFFLSYVAYFNPYIKSNIVRVNKILFLFFIGICVVGISWATINRGHKSIVQEFIYRYTLSVPLFEHYYYSNILDTHTYGSSTFEFLVSFFNFLLKPFDLGFEIIYNNSIIQNGVYIPALGRETNAYTTEYFNYIRDWGIFGVFIGPLILSFLYNLFYLVLKKNSFFMVFFVVGVLSWNMESHFAFLKNNSLSIIYCILLYKYLKPRHVCQS